MTATIKDLLDDLDRLAPLLKAGGWDPVGLQFGDPAVPVGRVAVCHEVTGIVAAHLDRKPVDLLIAYHPLLFRPTTRLVPGSGPAGRAFDLISRRIALGVVHTAWDVAKGGTADALADVLGLADVTGFGPNWGADAVSIAVFVPESDVAVVVAAMTQAGAGRIGNYSGCSHRTPGTGTYVPGEGANPSQGRIGEMETMDEVRVAMVAPAGRLDAVVAALVAAHPYEEPAYDIHEQKGNAGFIGRRGRLPVPVTLDEFVGVVTGAVGGSPRVAGVRSGQVRQVAVVPGSGGSFMGAAGDVDVVVTGDVGHHDARGAVDRGLAVVDPGHAATERPGVARLYAAVAEIAGDRVDDVIDLTQLDADPWEG